MLVPQRYSERLGVIEPDQLYEVAERFDLGELRSAIVASEDPFCQDVLLEASGGCFVLRGNPYGHVQLAKERHVAAFLDERSSLPAPWPYRVCEDDDTFGWAYAVFPRPPGEAGRDLVTVLDDESRVDLAYATGDALARLHEATADLFGPYDGQLDNFVELDDFRDWFLHRLDHWRRACRSVNALATEAERYIDAQLEACADALDEPFNPVLVHAGFVPEALSFEEGDDGFEATGIWTLADAILSDGEEDLVRMLRDSRSDDEREAFLEAYTEQIDLGPGVSERVALYALGDGLRMWERSLRLGAVSDEEATFMTAVAPLVERARRAVEAFAPED